MRKFILFLLLFVGLGVNASAQTQVTASRLVGLGLPAPLAKELAKLGDGTGTILANGDYAQAYDESGNIHDVWGVDANGNTELLAPSGEDLELVLEGDEQRIVGFDASSDTALRLFFGDAGATANQNFALGPRTGSSDDDASVRIHGGGTFTRARGAYIGLDGVNNSSQGDLTLNAPDDIISTADGDFTFAAGATTDLTIADNLITMADGTDFNFGTGSTIHFDANNEFFLTGDDQSGNIHELLKIDSGGNTFLNAPDTEAIILNVDATNVLRVDETDVTITGELNISGVTGSNAAVCVKSDGNFGVCSDAVGGGGTCTCG